MHLLPSSRLTLLAISAPLLLSRSAIAASPQAAFRMSSSSPSSAATTLNLPAQDPQFEAQLGGAGANLDQRTERLVADSVSLFSAKPSPEIFARSWNKDAIFADPIAYAEGARQYMAQWYGMPAAFSASELLKWRLVKSDADEVQYVQRQRYKIKLIGVEKEITSTVALQLDHEGKIKRFEDRWDHKPLPSGSIAMGLRKLNAVTVPLVVGVPKESKQVFEPKKEL
ncbi:uncharacterized protein PFL1_05606 [Pseudozyma flocculosa PF-1]|uniref:SnoaL-like domain-containing protein n=2 Tax=Pseudozyma flocculosa TaxID=84751 RepID=A0A5C3FBS8_9BASI|nr:uncharacterized protein PFL1_05606 [Pseudozyma flocculosa PF-1]EPQ26971.1 hypothetical protein PFL1_05606 [Pseudozyma flocculosa PF-1]SPO41117.1 uncharacterized protein PSFLO_06599 [Pseudozyma flocculosa]